MFAPSSNTNIFGKSPSFFEKIYPYKCHLYPFVLVPSTNLSRRLSKGLREALGMVVDPLVERTFGGRISAGDSWMEVAEIFLRAFFFCNESKFSSKFQSSQ